MHHNLLLASLAVCASFIYKAANQANSTLWCISYTGYVLAKEIVSLLSLQLMYSYLNELEFYIHSLAGIAFLLGLQ